MSSERADLRWRVGNAVSRIALSTIFVRSGWHIVHEPGERRVEMVERAGMSRAPELVRLSGSIMLAGGAAMVLFPRTRWAPAMLAGLLVIITPVGHPFWRDDSSERQEHHRLHTLKNVGLLGGLVAIMTAPRVRRTGTR